MGVGDRDEGGATLTHYWRIRKRLPERFGEPCTVLARGRMNSILIQFADGKRVVTSGNFVRKTK